jgi:predicted TIM-barrel fold metal-dependent hydrolase
VFSPIFCPASAIACRVWVRESLLFDLPLARELATLTNERIADAVRRHPDRFSGLAAVALQDVDFSVRELRRSVTELGLRGVIVNSHSRGQYLDDPRFEEFWATAAELQVPVYLHPNTPSDPLIGPRSTRGSMAPSSGSRSRPGCKEEIPVRGRLGQRVRTPQGADVSSRPTDGRSAPR